MTNCLSKEHHSSFAWMAKVTRVGRKGKEEVFRQVDRLDRTQCEKLAGEVSKDNLARQEAQHNKVLCSRLTS